MPWRLHQFRTAALKRIEQLVVAHGKGVTTAVPTHLSTIWNVHVGNNYVDEIRKLS
jgi:hypothetical protein